MPGKHHIEYLPIPLDADTRARLARFGRAAGKHPSQAAADLLRDLLLDDEHANMLSPPGTGLH